jgi:hypothetical protein
MSLIEKSRIATNTLQSPPSDNTSQSKYVLEHIFPPSIHPHLKPQMFGFVARKFEGGEHVQAESHVTVIHEL